MSDTDPGLAAARAIQFPRKLSNEDWNAMLDYLQDNFKKEYGDMEFDDLQKLNKRMVAEKILRHILKEDSPRIYASMLANKYIAFKNAKSLDIQKRKREERDSEIIAQNRRLREEGELKLGYRFLLGCEYPPRPTGTDIDNSIVKYIVDPTIAGHAINIPAADYQVLIDKGMTNLYAHLSIGNYHVYARINGFHEHNNMIHVSPKIDSLLPEALNPQVLLRFCVGAAPLTRIELRFYGDKATWESDRVVPKDFQKIIEEMPIVSRGQVFTNNLGYQMRVQALYSGDKEVFAAQLPATFVERDIAFKFEAETPDNIGCFLCSNPTNALYCSSKCAHEASMMICDGCGKEATHKCSGCHSASYCSEKCQKIGWITNHHKLVCGNGKRGLTSDDDASPTRRRTSGPSGYDLPVVMQQQMYNTRFLQNYIEQHGLDYIRQFVFGATKGVEGALNHNNLFWFYVSKKIIADRKYDPSINYRDWVAA